MGDFMVKDPDTNLWVPKGLPYVRTTSGWAKAKQGYRKSAVATWTPFWTLDTTAPVVPVVATLTISTAGKLNISVTAPVLADVREVMVKVGTAVSNNSMTDANFIAAPDGYDESWSLWKMTSGQTRTKTWPVAGTLTKGKTYFVTAWTIDWARNMSTAVSRSILYVATGAQPVSKSAYVTTVDSATFNKNTKAWVRTTKNLNLAGSGYGHGLWFYSTKIAAALTKAKTITKMQIEIQRVNSGVATATAFRAFSHSMATYSPIDIHSPSKIVGTAAVSSGTLLKGQAKNYLIVADWVDTATGGLMAFKTGVARGLGIYASASTDTASYYGFGTNSGRVYLEWTE